MKDPKKLLLRTKNVVLILLGCIGFFWTTTTLADSSAVFNAGPTTTSANSGDFTPQPKDQPNRVSSPAISFASPTAWGADWGQVFAAVSGATGAQTSDRHDGAIGVGAGIGNANKNVGLEAVASILSINPQNSTFGNDGSFSFKLHRNLPWASAVAVGIENVGRWGQAKVGSKNFPAAYISLSKAFFLRPHSFNNPMPLYVTVGAGNTRFAAVRTTNIGEDKYVIRPFASIAYAFIPQVSAIVDYSAEKLNVGASYAPFPTIPVTITAGISDVTQRVATRTNFVGSIGYVYNFE